MEAPKLLPTKVNDETYAGVTYHINGELVPVLTVNVGPSNNVYFEHHIILWKSPTVDAMIRPLKGLLKRMMAGMQIFITETSGNGQIAFSRDGAGHIVPIHLERGQELHVREHQFLAATGNVDYSFERVKGAANMLFGGNGFFLDKFKCSSEGIVWLHGYGNVLEVVLGAGEKIDVEPGAWLYKDPTVQMAVNIQKLSTGLLGSMNFITNRFTGPGRLGIQSMAIHFGTTE